MASVLRTVSRVGYSLLEAAKLLKCRAETVRWEIENKKLVASRTQGNYHISETVLNAYAKREEERLKQLREREEIEQRLQALINHSRKGGQLTWKERKEIFHDDGLLWRLFLSHRSDPKFARFNEDIFLDAVLRVLDSFHKEVANPGSVELYNKGQRMSDILKEELLRARNDAAHLYKEVCTDDQDSLDFADNSLSAEDQLIIHEETQGQKGKIYEEERHIDLGSEIKPLRKTMGRMIRLGIGKDLPISRLAPDKAIEVCRNFGKTLEAMDESSLAAVELLCLTNRVRVTEKGIEHAVDVLKKVSKDKRKKIDRRTLKKNLLECISTEDEKTRLTHEKCAKILGVCETTVRNYINEAKREIIEELQLPT